MYPQEKCPHDWLRFPLIADLLGVNAFLSFPQPKIVSQSSDDFEYNALVYFSSAHRIQI